MPKSFCQQCHQRIKKKELPRCIRCRLLNYEEQKKVAKINKKGNKKMATFLLDEEEKFPEELETPEEEKTEEEFDTTSAE